MAGRYRQMGWTLVCAGMLCMMMSLGSTWGVAYGQTSGPTPTPQGVVLSMSKTVDDTTVAPGDVVVFTIQVTNRGDGAARDVVVEDNVPPAFAVQGASTTAGTATVNGQTVTVSISELAPGAGALITITTEAIANADGATVNQVNARALDVQGGTVTGDADVAVDIDPKYAAPSPSGTAQPSATARPSATTTPSAGGSSRPGSPGAGDQPSQLPDTGATTAPQWSVLLFGVGVALAGAVMVLRTRKA